MTTDKREKIKSPMITMQGVGKGKGVGEIGQRKKEDFN